MISIFTTDLYRYYGNDAKRFSVRLRSVLCTPGITYTYLIRKAQYCKPYCMRPFWRGLLHVCKLVTGIQIPSETKIGYGFRILHFGTIVVNPETIIGNNFNIAQGVLIGRAVGTKVGSPHIGNNCCAFANSIIIGGITIGDNVLVAPGAFVNFDVPDNSIVIGNPGKIIPRDSSPTAKYIVYNADDFLHAY